MGRGKSFDHKKKDHPGKFPKSSEMKEPKNVEHEEEFLVTKEAFKNRIEE
ncbi:hypothetical protein [Litchfieldia salsa]|uniref:Uncharacterized protein n=1 Tax=Litchfieldia salsa TaxID=930152 RepID=A0A1H0VYX6_9BACI|nr:hypothetical protein [Litchfieldia salsa]SDP83551.1 hypothetical protein SAMN05216565_10888 [Litchfieldia salsa]